MARKKEIEKYREWEKERRDKLNYNFMELSKLLPDHDPSMNPSKKHILTQAAEYIKTLQEQNKQILKEGTDNILKIEAERLRRRVAQLLLKTKLLVEALRTAGVPIPRKVSNKDSQNKKLQTLNQNKLTNTKESAEGLNLTKATVPKKKVKCGCDKVKGKGRKIPLKEINTTINSNLTVTSSSNEVSKSSAAATNKKKVISTPTTVPIKYIENKIVEVPKTTSSVLIPITQTGLINGSVLASGVQALTPVLERNVLSSLGPGTLILADGRVVSVPPMVSQIVMKPPTALIVMHNTKRKEKLIIPKRTEITKTTYSNKTPIPAIKHYRLESVRSRPTVSRGRSKSSSLKLKSKLVSPKGNTQMVKRVKKNNPPSSSDNKPNIKTNAELSCRSLEKEVNPVAEQTSSMPKEVNKDISSECKSIENRTSGENSKRKSEDSTVTEPPTKVVKSTCNSKGQEQSQSAVIVARKRVQNCTESRCHSIGEPLENNSYRPDESHALNESMESHCDKEDASKANQNKYTIDALFKKPDEAQNLFKKPDDVKSVPRISEKTIGEQLQNLETQQNNDETVVNISSNVNSSCINQSLVNLPADNIPPPSASHGLQENKVAASDNNIRVKANHIENNISASIEIKQSSKDTNSIPSTTKQLVSSEIINSCANSMANVFSKNTLTTTSAVSYSSNSETTGFKGDCILSSVDFLRTREAQDQRNSFMPIIDDVRLTSEFSSDLFNSLQVPSAIGGQHPESISPTAAFLLAFPLVSTSKNADNPVDGENHENPQTSTPTTILQIGNIEPPGASELFHSIDYPPKNVKHFGNKESVDRYPTYELSAEYETSIDVQKTFRNSSEKKKGTSLYSTHDEYRNKSQRRQHCDQGQMSHERPKENQNSLASICAVGGTSGYHQQHSQQPVNQDQQQCYIGYPLFTSSNDFSSNTPAPTTYTSQYSTIGVGTDTKTDAINMLPWTTSSHVNQQQDYTSVHTLLDKDVCPVQKSKTLCERKSKSDKITQKSYNYNFNQYNNVECYGFKSDKKKNKQQQAARAPVNWMTTPDSRNILPDPLLHLDMYTPQKDMESTASFSVPPPPGGMVQNPFANTFPSIEMSIDGFPEFNTSKKSTNNYCWSPSKCLMPPSVDNHGLVIPSTLPTLVGDLALGTTSTAAIDNNFKPFESNNRKSDQAPRKLSEKTEKKRNDFVAKNQVNNSSFLSVSQLVDPKCKKQTKHQQQQVDLNKNFGLKRASTMEKTTPKFVQRTNFNYTTVNTVDRKDHRLPEPNCMYSSNNKALLPPLPSQWNDKQRNTFKGGSYSAESLIGVQQQNMGQNQGPVVSGDNGNLNNIISGSFHNSANLGSGANYQAVQSSAVNYFQGSTDYGVQSNDPPQGSHNQYHQNCFNFPTGQSHFSAGFMPEDYQIDNFVGFNVSGSSSHCQPQQAAATINQSHQHSHQPLQQQPVINQSKQKRHQVNSNINGKCPPRDDHTTRTTNEGLYHNSRTVSSSSIVNSSGFIHPPPQVYHPGYSFPPPSSKVDTGYTSTAPICSQHLSLTTNTTTTLTNFNLSTIFPEMNDQRGPPPPSHLNASTFTNMAPHNYHHHHPSAPSLPH